MKKIALILAALMLGTSIVLASCSKTDDVKEKDNGKQEDVNTPENEENGEVASKEYEKEFSEAKDISSYYSVLEKAVEEYKPKTDLDNEVLATINGIPVSAANVKYTTWVLKAPESSFTEEEIKAETEKFYLENTALLEVAYENGIGLTKDDKTTIKANITGLELQLGDNYAREFENSAFTEFFYYFQTSVYSALYNNLYEDILADRDNEITKSSIEDAKSELVRAKHILIQFPEGEGENGALTDEQKAAVLAEAEAVLAEVNAMADISEFDALIEKYNDDPGMTSNPDGYYFGRGEMVPEFEESAFTLEEGETSGLVETSYGYHILLKLPLEDEDVICNSAPFHSIFNTKLYEYISARTEDMKVEYAENHDERVEEFISEYNETMARLEAEAETAE